MRPNRITRRQRHAKRRLIGPEGVYGSHVEAVVEADAVCAGMQQDPSNKGPGVDRVKFVAQPAEIVDVAERGGTRRLDLHRHHLPVVTLKNKVNFVVLPVAVMPQIAALSGRCRVDG